MSTLSGTTSKSQWPFSPQSIPGLSLWLDGADTSSITGTSTVTAWKDKSGKGNDASGTGGLSYTAGQGITFNGTNGYFSVPGVANSIVGTPFTVFVAEKVAVLPPSGLPMGIFTNDPNTGVQYGGFFTCYNNSGSVTFGWYAGDQTSSTTYSVGSTRILNFNYTGTNRTILVNGTSVATESWTQNLITGAFTQPVIGRLWGTYYYNGTISELMLYIGNINTQQYQQVEGYLAQKWGLQVNLPATHPYYATTTMQLYQRPVFQRAFQPVDIPGLSLWLDAADLTSLTISSGNVTAWRDKSGNGYIATQSPLTSGSITKSTQNNLNVVAMNSQVMTIPSFSWTAFATMFFVVNTPSWFYCAGSSGYNGYVGSFNWGLYNFIGYPTFNDSVLPLGTQVIPTNQWCIFSIGYGGGIQASNYCVNGTSRSTTTITPVGNSTVVTPLWFSGRWDSTSGDNAIIAEIIHYNNELTTSQRQQVESYLAWKWGLVSPLATGHPGKLIPSFSTTFTPKSVTGLSLWLDGADPLSMIISGSSVSTWNDKSGLGNSPTSSSGTYPTYSSTLNAVQWTGGAQQLTFPSTIATAVSNSSFTVFFVSQRTASNENFIIRGTAQAVNQNLLIGYEPFGTPVGWRFAFYGNDLDTAFPSYSAGEAPTLSCFMYSTATSTQSSFLSGSISASASRSSSALSSWAGAMIGGNNIWPGLNANVYEVLIYNAALTIPNRQQIEGYLSWKWGLQSNLPDTHAYKKIKP